MKKVLLGLLFLFVPIMVVNAEEIEITQAMLDAAFESPETKVGFVTYKPVTKTFDFGVVVFTSYYDYYYIDPGDYKLGSDVLLSTRDAGGDVVYVPYLVFTAGNSTLNLNEHKIGIGLLAVDDTNTANLTVKGDGIVTSLNVYKNSNITIEGGTYTQVYIEDGTLLIKNATLDTTLAPVDFHELNGITFNGSGNLTIEDGTFIAEQSVIFATSFVDGSQHDVNIKGGTFKIDNNHDLNRRHTCINLISSYIKSFKLSGGTFESVIGAIDILFEDAASVDSNVFNTYLADGYKYSEELDLQNDYGVDLRVANNLLSIVPIEETNTETNEETSVETKETKNPKTNDNILIYISLLFVSLYMLANKNLLNN